MKPVTLFNNNESMRTSVVYKISLSVLLSFAYMFTSMASNDGNEMYFKNIGLENGLSQLSVITICQDAKGYIWFGTRNGLNRFDGSHVIVYKHDKDDPNSLADNYITSMTMQGDSLLWVGTMHGLNRIDLRSEIINRPDYPEVEVPIRSILFDSAGRFWLGTPQGVYLHSDQDDKFLPFSCTDFPRDAYIMDIRELSNNRITFCTEHDGLYIFDADLKKHQHFDKDNILPSNGINNTFEDSLNRLWILTHTGGLICMDGSDTCIYNSSNSSLTTNDIRCCAEIKGTLYIGTADGMYMIDPALPPANSITRVGNLSHYSVFSMCKDRNDGLWIGTYAGGVNYYNSLMNRFRTVNLAEAADGITGPVVCSDNTDELFIATEGGGLLQYGIKTGKAISFLYDVSNTHGRNILKSLLREGDKLYCGTRQGDVFQFDIKKKSFSHKFKIAPNVPVYAIKRDKMGNTYCVTTRPGMGLVKISPEGVVQTEFKVNGIERGFNSARCLTILDDGRLLLGTTSEGLYVIDFASGRASHYGTEENGSGYIPSDNVSSIAQDSKGHIWIGLNGSGIALLGNDASLEGYFCMQNGLANDEVSTVVADGQDNIWIASNGFISKFDPILSKFYNYKISSTLEFTPNCGALLQNGYISLSTSNGLIMFNPEELKTNSLPPTIVLNQLSINNVPISVSEGSPLELSLDNTKTLRLKHNQNDLIISYCALNFLYPEQNMYAYRLSGYEENWNYVGNRQEAYFTKLKPGKYTFEVKASNNDGVWNDDSRALKIKILPPVWATWYAYMLYILLAALVLRIFLFYQINKRNLEQELQFKKKEQIQQEEFHKQKMRMFTNFSHELRTPLMLILSPLDELLSSNIFTPDIKGKLDLIYNSSQRLSSLVDQILDLSKSQAGKTKMKVSEGNLSSFLDEICLTFKQIAYNKGVCLEFNASDKYDNVWFDPGLFEKIAFNLLSNAIKNTPDGGKIDVALNDSCLAMLPEAQRDVFKDLPQEAPLIELMVKDTGNGIPEDEIAQIFEPFYQAGNSMLPGTGIGLSLSSSIARLHHGTIWADNNTDGGACFHVVFPSMKSLYKEDELEIAPRKAFLDEIVSRETVPADFSMEKRYTVLLVEDNTSVREYIKSRLEHYFDVIEADNGDTAWKLTCLKFPHLVISDIMMPGKNGLELCRMIKDDLYTGHIPVVLMTAKSMAAHIIEGLDTGADDYLIKPFNIDVLLCRIRNILINREKLKQIYGRMQSEQQPDEPQPIQDRFTKKFYEIIEENISNSSLSIDLICREIGISRTNLYRKLKAVTDLSPVELIRRRRLEIAAKMLETGTSSVFDIATYTGFNSLAYFSSCFKSYFNCTPTEFKESHKNNKQ